MIGKCPCCDYRQPVHEAIERAMGVDGVIAVHSLVRCPKHNKAVGGVKRSYHLHGKACDLVSTLGLAEWRELGYWCYQMPTGAIHIDTRYFDGR